MNIDYLDLILSVCFTMRKMRTITIQEGERNFALRPQLHIMIISPFGTFKSSMTRQLELMFEKSVFKIDDFTKAAMEGSINKDGEYVPSLIIHLGGKVMIIDEWNNVDFFGQGSLLGLLENQRVSRSIGFKVKIPFKYKCRFGWIQVVDNKIEGEMNFSCIAHAMEYPVHGQKDKALLSRFTPLFIEPTLEYIKKNTRGEFKLSARDCSQNIDSVTISHKAYLEFHDAYFDYVAEHKLIPLDTDDYGYLSRIMSDILRMGIYNYLAHNVVSGTSLTIDDSSVFKEMFIYIHTLMLQFNNPKTTDKLDQYLEMMRKSPGQNKEFYYRALGISRRTLYEYDKKLGRPPEVEFDEKGNIVTKEDKKRVETGEGSPVNVDTQLFECPGEREGLHDNDASREL